MKHHVRHMAIAGGVVLAVFLALRVDARTAVQYALLLACPLGMVGMMAAMSRRRGGDHTDHEHHAGEHRAGHDERERLP